jgi:hypothetical protein
VLKTFIINVTLRSGSLGKLVHPPSVTAAATDAMKSGTLSIEDQRQLIYSSLLRYTSETTTLRERVLDRVVLGGLIGSTSEGAFRVGKIVENLRFGNTSLTIRVETVQETLQRLITQEKVRQTEVLKRHAYYLTESANAELSTVVSSAEADFDAALKRMLKDTAHSVEFAVAASICRRFILECFARFGKVIAKTVTGRIRPEELPRILDTRDAFTAALEGHRISPETVESIRARCSSFLKSSDPNDQKVKFHLTQGYYFAQLLGFEDSAFNPLQDHAFAEAILYLDTNVVIVGVLYIAEHSTLFDELITLTKRLGVELRVTRATLNEARHVAHDRLTQITKIIAVVPKAVIEHTDDQFVIAFLNARDNNAALTPDEFMQPFDRLAELLAQRWNITIEDRAEDDVLAGRDIAEVCRIIDEEAEKLREFHDDVMATPTDQLLLALDYIKSKTLQGKPYRSSYSQSFTGTAKVSLVEQG